MKNFVLSSFIRPDNIFILKSKKKDSALKELLNILCKNFKIKDSTKILAEIQKREKESPTAFGRGIAIPHYRIKTLKGLLLITGLSPKGIDYEAHDGIPVRIIFLILAGKNKEKEYIKLVAELVKFVKTENIILHDNIFKSAENFMECVKSFDNDKMPGLSSKLQNILRYEELLNEINTLNKEITDNDENNNRTITEHITELKKELENLSKEIDRSLLERILRLAGKFNNSISARIFNDSCSYCFSQPSAIEINNVKKGEIVFCVSCGKVLYIKD